MKTIKLFAPGFSYYGRVVRLMMQYKALSYELTRAPFGEDIPFFSEAHRELHPFKKIPVLIDGDFILNESIAMMNYIDNHENADSNRPLLPKSPKLRAQCLAATSHLNSDVHSALLRQLILEFAFPKGENNQVRLDYVDANIDQAHHALTWIEEQITANFADTEAHFLCGTHFSAADAYLLPAIDYLEQLPQPYNLVREYPNTVAYLAYQRLQNYCSGVLGPAELKAA